MKELRVLIEAKQLVDSEGRSAWFTLPIHEEELEEALGIEADSVDYRIIEKDVPFADEVSEDASIDEFNRMYEMIEELPEKIIDSLDDFISYYGSLEGVVEHKDQIRFYPGCDSMEDVARYCINELHTFGELPPSLKYCILSRAVGRTAGCPYYFRKGLIQVHEKNQELYKYLDGGKDHICDWGFEPSIFCHNEPDHVVCRRVVSDAAIWGCPAFFHG